MPCGFKPGERKAYFGCYVEKVRRDKRAWKIREEIQEKVVKMITVKKTDNKSDRRIKFEMNVNDLVTVYMTYSEAKELRDNLTMLIKEGKA